jgi:hypothetical protein
MVAVSMPDASARTVRVFAGISAHAEAGAGIYSNADAELDATIGRICLTAT